MFRIKTVFKSAAGILAAVALLAQAQELPIGVVKQLPGGHEIIEFASGDFNGDHREDFIVVVRKQDEAKWPALGDPSPRRPLLAFIQEQQGKFILVARNDTAVLATDEGGQCDPFLDGGQGLAVKGPYLTVQNGVACGKHWTDYVTFRYSRQQQTFVFHKRIFEYWANN